MADERLRLTPEFETELREYLSVPDTALAPGVPPVIPKTLLRELDATRADLAFAADAMRGMERDHETDLKDAAQLREELRQLQPLLNAARQWHAIYDLSDLHLLPEDMALWNAVTELLRRLASRKGTG